MSQSVKCLMGKLVDIGMDCLYPGKNMVSEEYFCNPDVGESDAIDPWNSLSSWTRQ